MPIQQKKAKYEEIELIDWLNFRNLSTFYKDYQNIKTRLLWKFFVNNLKAV